MLVIFEINMVVTTQDVVGIADLLNVPDSSPY